MDTDFAITLEGFGDGLSTLAHIDTKTFIGSKGQAAEMQADVVSNPGFLQQSPALVDLINGNQAGEVKEPIRFILDKPVTEFWDTPCVFAVGTTKLFLINSNYSLESDWAQTITGMTEGESIIRLKDHMYIFYNKSSGGDIASMNLMNEIDPDWGSSTDQALEKAPQSLREVEDTTGFKV
jgi:hypothetical protein